MILSEMTREELELASQDRVYPKWWTLCLMRLLGLPTLDACLVPSAATRDDLHVIVGAFLKAIGKDHVLVRSDGGREHRSYPRGGITYGRTQAFEAIKAFLSLERTVVLLEPTNRFANKLSVNVTLAADSSWVAEALGCGFDTSDLQRSLVTPEWGWSGTWRPTDFSPIDTSAVGGGALAFATSAERIRQRLRSIADLLVLGDGETGEKRAEEFLLASDNTCLFSGPSPTPSRREVARVVNDAILIGGELGTASLPFTLSFARLADRRRIYWDVAFGLRKWREA